MDTPTEDELTTILSDPINLDIHVSNLQKFEVWDIMLKTTLAEKVRKAMARGECSLEGGRVSFGNATHISNPHGWALPNYKYVERCLLKAKGYATRDAFVTHLYEATGLSPETVGLNINIDLCGNSCGPSELLVWCKWPQQPKPIPPESETPLTKAALREMLVKATLEKPETVALNAKNKPVFETWWKTVLETLRTELAGAAKSGKQSYTTPQVYIEIPSNSPAYKIAFLSSVGFQQNDSLVKKLRRKCFLDNSLEVKEILVYKPDIHDGFLLSVEVSW